MSGVLTVNNNIKASQYRALDNRDVYLVAASDSYVARLCAKEIHCNNTGVTANVAIYAADFVKTSSIRYKENVKDLDLEYAKQILKLRPVTYDYKNKENGVNCVGLIAEEVYEHVSYPVIFSQDIIEGLDYSELVTPILKILQDHEKRLSLLL